MDAPTTFLPSLKRLDTCTAPQIHNIITRLGALHLPAVRGTALADEDLESLQADDFERSSTIRWLTGFIARGAEWVESYTHTEQGDLDDTSHPTSPIAIGRFQTEFHQDTYQARTTAYDRAAALLGVCAGTSAAGPISREFKFYTVPQDQPYPDNHSFCGADPISITLRDESISVGDHTAVGLQTWGSACILAERVACDPTSFGLPTSTQPGHRAPNSETRILELGAGTGLLSLLAGKLVQRAGSTDSKYTIIATDYHPAVLDNLRANIQSNFPEQAQNDNPPIVVHDLDWSLYTTGKPTTDLSRVPSLAPTPAIGTPIGSNDGGGRKILTLAPYTPLSTVSATSDSSTPALSFSSTSSHTPPTPHTPRTVRSPPPNLARAVFSRLVARGVEFEMPSGSSGIDQNTELSKKLIQDNFANSASLGSIPNTPRSRSLVAEVISRTNPTHTAEVFLVEATRSDELLCAKSGGAPDVSGVALTSQLVYLDNTKICNTHNDGRSTSNNEFKSSFIGDTTQQERHRHMCLDDADGSQASNRSPDGSRCNLSLEEFNMSQINVNTMITYQPINNPATQQEREETQIPYVQSEGLSLTVPEKVQDTMIKEASLFSLSPSSDRSRLMQSEPLIPAARDVDARGGNMPMITNAAPTSYDPAPEDTTRTAAAITLFDRPFDTIFGADVVYEHSHANLVRAVVERLLRKPSYSPTCPPAYFHLIMPLRPTHADEANSVDLAFPRAEDVHASRGIAEDEEVLAIVATEMFTRNAGVGRSDEVKYVHYRVGWV